VIDRASHRLQKFDSSGNFIAGIDVEELADDNSNSSDPWGITVGPQGEVVVADTFGHRIRIYDGDLNPLTSFGEPPSQSETPGKFELFGPRDAIFDADGNIWVTDTGHDRIMVFTPDGEFLRQVGGPGSAPGEFDEPVGLAIDSDGTVFVADMWNSRVQLLDATGEPIGEFGVSGWGGFDAADKPYLAALPDGRVAVGLPLLNEVRIYERDGTLYWTFTPWQEGLDRPYGLLPLTDGRLWIAEGGSRRVRLFEIP
jgi:DNA-binding beta-propeller fold protein YncE